MKTVKKNVYYCDFCNRHSLRSLTQHEEHCTLNPFRKCRLCNIDRDYPALVNMVVPRKDEPVAPVWEILINELMDSAGGCPVCALTIFRLYKNKHRGEYEHIELSGFNYKDEVQKWWDAANDESLRNEAPEYY